ncbi:MAG: ABC transporter substrate-binding protein, partial [Alphaproteobacteria bacterium]|nr:ABC transporter substrate-binding protein [Alphaproteobacteria bacterium]
IKGDVAESWTIAPDKRSYTFKLRPNVLFHDGSRLTSADVKASYDRIVNPPEGVVSARRASYAAISAIETPDARTVIFRMRWPEAAMLANFASPWNCIYSAAKLAEDPQFPKTHVLGTGPFVFVEHVAKSHWTGKRWDKYFEPGKPYLDGYEARFMSGEAVIDALQKGAIQAQFRSVTPTERDRLASALGDKVDISEAPWLINLLVDFNTRHPPFGDVRVRRALSLAIDRWQAATDLSSTTYLKFVGGVLRPGFAMATPETELAALPGLSHDIAKSRAEAKRLLAEAGATNLSFTLTNRDIPLPYGPAARFVIDAWREIGVTATEKKFNTKEWEGALQKGDFDVAFDFGGDYFDDPTQQLARYISPDLSPINYSGATDRMLDAFFVGQAVTSDPRQRVKIVREFERRVFDDATVVPLLWWNRIIANSSRLKGWAITPSHYLNQDLADVWLEPAEQHACADGGRC